jgi:hypothetical protein
MIDYMDALDALPYLHRREHDYVRRAAERMVTERDGIVLAVLRHMLARPDLLPQEIEPHRLMCVTHIGHPYVTWMLDGKPIVRFWEPECRSVVTGEPMIFSQRYQVLA